MKRLVSSIFLTSCLWAVANLSEYPQSFQSAAPVSTSSNLFDTFYGQQIRLALRSDIITVPFKPQMGGTRRPSQSLYLGLQQALQGSSDGWK